MENEAVGKSQKGKPLIILGFITIAVLFIVYGRYQDPEFITPDAVDDFQRMATGFTLFCCYHLVQLHMVFTNITSKRLHKIPLKSLAIIALITWNSKSRKIFIATFIAYGIFFSLTFWYAGVPA